MEEDIEMGEDNIDMEEVLIYRKRPYRCVKRPETTDTKKNSDSPESIHVHAKFEDDNIEMEEHNKEM